MVARAARRRHPPRRVCRLRGRRPAPAPPAQAEPAEVSASGCPATSVEPEASVSAGFADAAAPRSAEVAVPDWTLCVVPGPSVQHVVEGRASRGRLRHHPHRGRARSETQVLAEASEEHDPRAAPRAIPATMRPAGAPQTPHAVSRRWPMSLSCAVRRAEGTTAVAGHPACAGSSGRSARRRLRSAGRQPRAPARNRPPVERVLPGTARRRQSPGSSTPRSPVSFRRGTRAPTGLAIDSPA